MTISRVYQGAPAEERTQEEQECYEKLAELNISFDRVDHDAADTMEDCEMISRVLDAPICKNLLLTTRNRKNFYLFCMPGDQPFSTKDFSKQVGSSRLSFAQAEDMTALLHCQPGSASILGLMHDKEHQVTLAVEKSVWEGEWFGCHPCRNTSSLKMRKVDVEKFLHHIGHKVIITE